MEVDRVDMLYDLLAAIFRSSEELERFLVLEGIKLAPERIAIQKQTRSADAYDVARALSAQGLVDAAFFQSLERRSPERAADIRAVAELFLSESAYPGTEPAKGDDPSPYADFAARLSASLSALSPRDDTDQSLDDEHWPWTAAASVLGSFDPMALNQLPGATSQLSALTALRDVVTTNHDGSWVLLDAVRTAALRRLIDAEKVDPAPEAKAKPVDSALEANAKLVDRRRDLVRLLLRGDSISLTVMERAELVDLDAVLNWLTPVVVEPLPVTREDVRAAAERRLLIDPLRSLVGTHFRGRAEELALIDAHVHGKTDDQLFLLRGAGGSGKSTLLGYVILQFEQRMHDDRVSFVYIDFDKARHDPRNSTSLLRQLAQQLRLLYATSSASEDFAALESVYSGTDVDRAAELLDIDIDGDAALLLDTLCERLLAVQAHPSDEGTPPLVLFLDTFEEVIAEGPGAVRDVGQLLADFWKRLPGMRVVVAGRSVPTGMPGQQIYHELSDLDPEAAGAVLENLGVRDPALRELVIDNFGGNPLTLRLAAEALHRAGSADEAFGDVLPRSKALLDTALEQVQGMLYSRILGHIRDAEVASVAHPGLAVRIVTVEILREVLAEPCGLDPSRVEEIFAKLRAEMSLFDLEPDGSLRHRQDVRRIMLRAMYDDPKHGPEIADIHRRAARYFQQQNDRAARTEEVYHRLMSDEDPRLLDPVWDGSMATSLAPALDEPLPRRAHRWLERRVVIGSVPEDVDEWDQEDWEANAYSRAVSWLASNEPSKVLEVLAEKSPRLTPSRLYAVEVAARLQLGDVEDAADALERGLLGSQGDTDRRVALDLAEQAVAVRAAQGSGAGVAEAALTCAAVADLTGEPARGIRALASAVTELNRLADEEHLPKVRAELSRKFEQLTQAQMRADPDLVRHVLHATGAEDAGVLAHAAVAVGDQTGEHDGVFFEDPFALTRLLDATTPAAQSAISRLAGEVGLHGTDWETPQLASLLVRTGRTGHAVTLSLDYATDKAATQSLVVDELVQPTHDVTGRSLA